VIVTPSRLMPPLVSVGTSVARIGMTCLPDESTDSSGSNDNRLSIPSVVFAERIGLSVLGERCVAMRNVPASIAAVVSPTRVQAASANTNSSAPKRRAASAASGLAFWPRIFSPAVLI
jgi:hypothetical protein